MTDSTKSQKREWRSNTWQWRALSATRLNQSQLGAVLIAVLGNDPILEHCMLDVARLIYGPAATRKAFDPPRFVSGGAPGWGANITSDGMIMSDFYDRQGNMHYGALVGSVEEMTDNFRGLADYLKLSDNERVALFTAVRQWIKTDARMQPTLF